MEVPDPEIPGTEDDIQKYQIQKVLNKLQYQMSLCFNIFIISIPIATCIMLYITYVYCADMKLKGHRNNPYFLYLSDIQYHKLPLVLESNIWGRVASYSSKTRAGLYQLL